MNKVSRRTVLGTVLPATLLGLILPRRSKAAARPAPSDQPHMELALQALRNARHQLGVAVPDKGGHRDKAIEHVDRAIEETQKGIDYARTH